MLTTEHHSIFLGVNDAPRRPLWCWERWPLERPVRAVLIVAILSGLLVWSSLGGKESFVPATRKATTAERLEQYGPSADARWAPFFKEAGVTYPPQRIVLVGLKEERRLEVYAVGTAPLSLQRVARSPDLHFIRSFAIHAASGGPGPKLAEGDRQVPEGLYGIELLNPNSRFHLSLRVSYPNQHDRARARRDRRRRLGGDIMIHGSNVSIGCLAMGDEAAEDLFVLAARTGIQKISVILAPRDLRIKAAPHDLTQPSWVPELYREIKSALASCCTGRVGGAEGAASQVL